MHRAVLLIGAVLLAGGCAGSDDAGDDATAAMVLETCAPGPSPDPVETEVCRCAYDELARRFDHDQLVRLDRQLRDDPENVPDEVLQVVLDCAFERVAPPEPTTTSSSTSTSSTTSSTSSSSTSSTSSTSTTVARPTTSTTRSP